MADNPNYVQERCLEIIDMHCQDPSRARIMLEDMLCDVMRGCTDALTSPTTNLSMLCDNMKACMTYVDALRATLARAAAMTATPIS